MQEGRHEASNVYCNFDGFAGSGADGGLFEQIRRYQNQCSGEERKREPGEG
jgi:hypothetical protein